METAGLCIQLKPETYKHIFGFAEKRHMFAENHVEQRLEEIMRRIWFIHSEGEKKPKNITNFRYTF